MKRDFSESARQRLLALTRQVEEDNLSDFTDWIGDRWYDFQTLIGELNIRNYIDDVNEYHRKVIDKNNTSHNTINRIFNDVRGCSSSYRSRFTRSLTDLQSYKMILQTLAAAMEPSNGQFNSSYIGNILRLFVAEYVDASIKEQREIIDGLRTAVQVQSDSKIIAGIDYTGEFIQGRCTWLDAVASAWSSNWINNLLSLFDIGEDLNEAAVRKSVESLIKSTLENRHTTTDFYDDFTNALTPEEFKNFKKVVDYTVKQGKVLTEMELATLLDMDVRTVTECDYLQILCAQTDLEFFNALSDGLKSTLGAYTDAVEAIDIASQMIGRLVNDYSEDLIYLESIRSAMIEGGYEKAVVHQIVDKIAWNYKNQAASAILIGVDKLYQEGAKAALGEALPMLNLFLAAKDVGCIVSGLEDKTDNLEMIYSTQHYSYALIEKYEAYEEKITSGDYTDADVENCKLYFDLARNAKIQEYEAMVNLYEGALDDVRPNVTTGLLEGVSSWFVSDAEEQAVADMIDSLNGEIVRLKELECCSSLSSSPTTVRSQSSAGGTGSAGGR